MRQLAIQRAVRSCYNGVQYRAYIYNFYVDQTLKLSLCSISVCTVQEASLENSLAGYQRRGGAYGHVVVGMWGRRLGMFESHAHVLCDIITAHLRLVLTLALQIIPELSLCRHYAWP
jgi:hypothetical protein